MGYKDIECQGGYFLEVTENKHRVRVGLGGGHGQA